MVKLDKIYTKGGDNGYTSIVGGKRVKKSSNIIVSLTVFSDTRFSITEKVEKSSTISEPDSSKVILSFFVVS